MRHIGLSAALLFLVSLIIVHAQNNLPLPPMPKIPPTADPISTDTLTNNLVRISTAIFQAGIDGDRAAIKKFLADDFLEMDAQGFLRDKAWNLENVLPRNERMSFQIMEPEVRKRAGFALLYYKLNVRYDVTKQLTGNANTVTDTYYPKIRVVDTFVKTKAGWKLLASSRIPLKN